MRERDDDWHGRTRMQKLAAVAYPGLTTENTRKQMAALSANERKKPPFASPLLADARRGATSPLGGTATVKR
jgi:hypothetical protein